MNSAIAIQPIASSQFLSVCNYITSFGIFLNNLGLIKIDERNQTVPVLNALFEYLNKFENQSEPKIQLLQKLLKETVHYHKGENDTDIDIKVAEKHYRYVINTALFSHYGYITGYLEEIIDKTENITSSILKQKVLQHLPGSYINNDQCSLAKGSLKLTLLATELIFRDYILPEFTETWATRSLSKGPKGDFQIKRTKRYSPSGSEDSALSTSDVSNNYVDMMSSISWDRGRLDLQSPLSDIGINAVGTGRTAGGRLDLQSPLSDIGNNVFGTGDTAGGRLDLQSPLSDIGYNVFGTGDTAGGRLDLQSPLPDIWNDGIGTWSTAGGRLDLRSPLSDIGNNVFGTGGTAGERLDLQSPLPDIRNDAFGTEGTAGGRLDLQFPLSDIGNNVFGTGCIAGRRLDLQFLSDNGNNAFGTGGTTGEIFHETPSTSRQAFEIVVNNQEEEEMTTRMLTIVNASKVMSSTNCKRFRESKVKSLRILKGYILRLKHLESNTLSVSTYNVLAHDYCKYGPNVLFWYTRWQIINGKYIDDVLFEKKFYVPEHLSGPVFEIKGHYGQRYIPPLANIAFEQYKNKLLVLQTKLRFEDFYYLRHGLMKECNIPQNQGDPDRIKMLAAMYRLGLRQCNEEQSDNFKVTLYQATMGNINEYVRLNLGRPGQGYQMGKFNVFSEQEARNFLLERQNGSSIFVLSEFELQDVCGIVDLSSVGTIPEDRHISLLQMAFRVTSSAIKMIQSRKVLVIKMKPSINIPKEIRMIHIVEELNKILLESRNLYMKEN